MQSEAMNLFKTFLGVRKHATGTDIMHLEAILNTYLVISGLALAFTVSGILGVSQSGLQDMDMFSSIRDNAPCYSERLSCVCEAGHVGFRDYVVHLAQEEIRKQPDVARNYELTYFNYTLNAVDYLANYKGCVPKASAGALAPVEMEASIHLLSSQLPRPKLIAFMKLHNAHWNSAELYKWTLQIGFVTTSTLTVATLTSLVALFAISKGKLTESSERSIAAAKAFVWWFSPIANLLYIVLIVGVVAFFIQFVNLMYILNSSTELKISISESLLGMLVAVVIVKCFTVLAFAMACKARCKSQLPTEPQPAVVEPAFQPQQAMHVQAPDGVVDGQRLQVQVPDGAPEHV